MSPISWHHLPLEVKLMIMNQASDFKSLDGLVSVDLSLTPYFAQVSSTLLPLIAVKSLSRTQQSYLRCHLFIWLAAKHPARPGIYYRTDDEVQTWPSSLAKYPVTTLREIVRLQHAVHYFAWTFVASRCQPPAESPLSGKEASPTASETDRIDRALGVFQALLRCGAGDSARDLRDRVRG